MKPKLLFAIGIFILLVCICLLIGIKELSIDTLLKSPRHMYLEYFVDTSRGTSFPTYVNDSDVTDSVDNSHCAEEHNSNLYIHLFMRPGRTGSSLFQVNCLLALTRRFCYNAMIESSSRHFSEFIHPFFDIRHVELHETVNNKTFHELSYVLSNATQVELSKHLHNWTLKDACYGYNYIVGQEEYIRASIKFKEEIVGVTGEYMRSLFSNRSTVAVHVRRTDRINSFGPSYKHSSLKWYIPYISKAMSYLRSRHSDLAFIFFSDDMDWCMRNFKGQDIYYSPFLSAGYDLALIAHCDHMIFTIGGYAWHGAWLGKKKSVIYSKDFLPSRYTKTVFIYPWWTGI